MKIRINRKEWLRGRKDPNGNETDWSGLYDPEIKAGCCLGHAVKQEKNCSWEDLAGRVMPSCTNLVYHKGCTDGSCNCDLAVKDKCTPKIFNEESIFANDDAQLAAVNDNDAILDEERERTLIKMFGSLGHELEFYN